MLTNVRKIAGLTGWPTGRMFVDRGIADRSRGSREAVAATEPRRLAAILAADVAGYSRLMGADEEGTLQRLRAHRRELVDPKIREHHGRIVKTTGDGMLVEFSSVVDAVRCAVEIQRAMVDRNAGIAEDKRITFRIGVNLGDVIIDGDDIYGDGVNIAARLEALAEPGGICISRTVRDHIGDRLAYAFDDMGEQSVKNIAQPVHAYAIEPGCGGVVAGSHNADASQGRHAGATSHGRHRRSEPYYRNRYWDRGLVGLAQRRCDGSTGPGAGGREHATPACHRGKSAPRLSIVVLPFRQSVERPGAGVFRRRDHRGFDHRSFANCGQLGDRSQYGFHLQGQTDRYVKQIGRELGVRYVLEGSVRRTGDQVRVNAQLIDAESGAHLWADRFDTDRATLAEAQSEITSRLARVLNVELVRDASRRIEQEKAVDPDARDLVMRGWAWLYRPASKENQQEALRAFERALEIDPRSSDARIGIARVLVWRLSGGRSSSSFEQDAARHVARAERLLLEALESDSNQCDGVLHHGECCGAPAGSLNRITDSPREGDSPSIPTT